VLRLEDGSVAVRLAREAVARALGAAGPGNARRELSAPFHQLRGAFVSWYDHPERHLRGCIGYPQPVLPLAEAIRQAAIAAALDDPRFPSVTAEELPSLVAEVSLLSPFEAIGLPERPRGVTVGRDGLSVERGRFRGLLLPQVATEQGWGPAEFLDGTCEKAGLLPGAWRSPDVTVYRFEAEVFRERTPGGEVVRASEVG
jgi:hypothetical protein